MVRKREARSAEFKAKVAFAAVAESQTVGSCSCFFVSSWFKHFLLNQLKHPPSSRMKMAGSFRWIEKRTCYVKRSKCSTTKTRMRSVWNSAVCTKAERISCCWMARCGLFRRTSTTRRLRRGEHSNSYPRFLAMKSSANFDHLPRPAG